MENGTKNGTINGKAKVAFITGTCPLRYLGSQFLRAQVLNMRT